MRSYLQLIFLSNSFFISTEVNTQSNIVSRDGMVFDTFGAVTTKLNTKEIFTLIDRYV